MYQGSTCPVTASACLSAGNSFGGVGVNGASQSEYFISDHSYSVGITANSWPFSVDISGNSHVGGSWTFQVGWASVTSCSGPACVFNSLGSTTIANPGGSAFTLSGTISGSAATPGTSYYLLFLVTTPSDNQAVNVGPTSSVPASEDSVSTANNPVFSSIGIVPLLLGAPEMLWALRRKLLSRKESGRIKPEESRSRKTE
jgi:hypothetical protein